MAIDETTPPSPPETPSAETPPAAQASSPLAAVPAAAVPAAAVSAPAAEPPPKTDAALAAERNVAALRALMETGEPSLGFFEERHDEALPGWKQAMADRSLDGVFLVARCTALGLGVGEDVARAAAMYRVAAEGGHVLAAHSLGFALSVGEGVPKDEAEALQWFERAAEAGFTPAMAAAGEAWLTGSGTEQDVEKGLALLCRAADAGNARAKARAGELLATSRRPERLATARKHLRAALDAGFRDAGVALGRLLVRMPDPGSREEGARLLESLADELPEAAEAAALRRIKEPGPKDRKRIAELLERASRGPDFSSHFELASALEFGWNGRMPDGGAARRLYQQAAQSDPRARESLDAMYGAKVECPRCELPSKTGRSARACPYCGLLPG